MARKLASFSIFSTLLVLAAPAGAATQAPGSDAPPDSSVIDEGSGDARVTLLTDRTAPVRPGQDAWVNFLWTADPDLEARNFRVTAVGSSGVEVDYPFDHDLAARSFSSLWAGTTLPSNGLDYTALRLVVDPEAVDPQITLTVSYESDTGPVTTSHTAAVDLDASPFEGDALALGDGTLGVVEAGSAAWLELEVTGLVSASEVRVRVSDPNGFAMRYPEWGEFSSLSQRSRIVEGETDRAAMRFDASDLAPGTYRVVIEVTAFVGLTPVTQTVERTVEVTAVPDPGSGDPGSGDPGSGDPGSGDPGSGGPRVLLDSRVDPGRWTVDPFGLDRAVSGVWAFGQPAVGTWQGIVTELGNTPSGANGLFTTSGTGTAVGDNDVDGGVTSILSPVISLPAGNGIDLELAYYFAHLNNASRDDYLRIVLITPNGNRVIVSETGSAVHRPASWSRIAVDLSIYGGQDVQLLIQAADENTASLIEAAVADLVIVANPDR